MKTVFRNCFFVLVAAGCSSPLSMYYREGAPVSRLQVETTDCQVKALKDAPVANQVRQTAPIYYPGRTRCDSAGRCYTTPGWWEPGRVYSVDVNQGLRNRVEAQCMAAKGYRPVSLPACKQEVKSQVPPQRTTTLPPLSPNSCFVRYDDGSFQIVTP